MVRGDVGLTLGDIDDQGVDVLVRGDIELDGCRESRAAETHQTAVADRGDQIGQAFDLGRSDVGRKALFTVAFDEDRIYLTAVGHGDFVDFFDFTGNTGMDRSADKGVASRDLLTDVHDVADLDQRLTRRADMLCHRQCDHTRHRQHQALFVRCILVVRSVYAALGAVGSLRKTKSSQKYTSFITIYTYSI